MDLSSTWNKEPQETKATSSAIFACPFFPVAKGFPVAWNFLELVIPSTSWSILPDPRVEETLHRTAKKTNRAEVHRQKPTAERIPSVRASAVAAAVAAGVRAFQTARQSLAAEEASSKFSFASWALEPVGWRSGRFGKGPTEEGPNSGRVGGRDSGFQPGGFLTSERKSGFFGVLFSRRTAWVARTPTIPSHRKGPRPPSAKPPTDP